MVRTTAVLLVGGRSRRMGEDKRWLRLFPASPTFMDRTVAIARLVGERVVVVGGSPGCGGAVDAEHVPDREAGAGPLSALATAIVRFPDDRLVVLACDYPMLQVDLVRRLISAQSGHAAAIPELWEGGGPPVRHPLVGCYDARWTGPLATQLVAAGERSMHALTDQLEVAWVQATSEADALSLTNVNSLVELATLRRAARTSDLPSPREDAGSARDDAVYLSGQAASGSRGSTAH